MVRELGDYLERAERGIEGPEVFMERVELEVEGRSQEEILGGEVADMEPRSQSESGEMVRELGEDSERVERGIEVPEVFFVNGKVLERVRKFKYLGSMETEDAKLDEEIEVRKQRMLGAYNKYDKSFFRSPISLKVKIRVFNMVIVTNALYGCQAWNATPKHIQQ